MAFAISCLADNQKFNFLKYIFDNMVKSLEGGVKFYLFPRFLQVFLDKKVKGMARHKEMYIISSHIKKIFANIRRIKACFSGEEIREEPKTVRSSAPIIEDWESDSEDECEDKTSTEKEISSNDNLVKSVKRQVLFNATKQNSAASTSTARPKGKNVTTAGPKAVVNAAEGKKGNADKSSACWIWKPKEKLINHTSKDSGSYTLKRFNYVDPNGRLKCSRHMTGNKSFLIEYQEIDGGFIAFGGSPKGGKITDHLGKFDGKADEGFLVGYSVNSKAFRVFNSRTRKVEENLHSLDINAGDQPRDVNVGEIQGDVEEISRNDDVCQENEIRINNSTHAVNTASISINTNCLYAYFLSQMEPKKVIQALKDPSWIEAMQEELLQFKLQDVWTLVDLPYGKRAISLKWVFRNKLDERVKTASTPMETSKPLLKDKDGQETVVANSTTEAEYVAASSCYGQVNDQEHIQALIHRTKVIITKESIRSDLLFDDAEGTACLLNEENVEVLARMRYEKPSQKLAFYKDYFTPQWKFLIHTILQCLIAKTTAWNEFNNTMASAIIYLADNQKFNFSKYIFGFSGKKQKPRRKQRKEAEVSNDETEDEDHVPTPSSDPLPSGSGGLKIFKKFGSGRRVKPLMEKDSLGAQEDASKQIALDDETQGRTNDDEMFRVDDLVGEEIVIETTTGVKDSAALTTDVTEDEFTMAQALAALKSNKRRDKGKAKMIEPEVPIKRKEQMRIDEEYARKLEAKEQEAARLSRAQQDEESNNS
nr:retrovirus-related Pol polyprotein from transposon TNT 1-94 [Tanacetum cinerariifolium]